MMEFTPGWYVVDSEGVQIPGTDRFDNTGEAIEKAKEIIDSSEFDELYLMRVRFKYSVKIQATTTPIAASGGESVIGQAGLQGSHPPSHALMEDDLG